jgi:membrane-bound inhibitor of C-type lysozyme
MIMRLCGFLAAFGFIAGATAGADAQMSQVMMKPKVTAFYMCNGLHFKAVYDNRPKYNRVSFVWGAKDYHLAHIASADGARYAGPTLEWRANGSNATLYSLPEHGVLATCTPGKRF